MKACKTYKPYLRAMIQYSELSDVMNEKQRFSVPCLVNHFNEHKDIYQSIKNFILLLIKEGYVDKDGTQFHSTTRGARAVNYYKVIKPVVPIRQNKKSNLSVITSTVKNSIGVICVIDDRIVISFKDDIIKKNAKLFRSKYNAEGYIMRVKSIIGKDFKFKIQNHEA